MNSRDLISISLLFSFEAFIQLIGNPILKFIKIYFQAIVLFGFTFNPGKSLLFLLLFDTSTTIIDMMINHGFYIPMLGGLLKIYQIEFGLLIKLDPWRLFSFMLMWVPFAKITALYSARFTVKRLKLRERVGYF